MCAIEAEESISLNSLISIDNGERSAGHPQCLHSEYICTS